MDSPKFPFGQAGVSAPTRPENVPPFGQEGLEVGCLWKPKPPQPAWHLPGGDSRLAGVVPAARLERPPAPLVSSGVAAVDALTGGLPRGALTEICGPVSSGRSSLLMAVLAEAGRRQELCALVDGSDRFDPVSAAAAGVDLDGLLWIRCGEEFLNAPLRRLEQALKVTDLLLQGGGFGVVAIDMADIAPEYARRIPLASWFRFRRAVEPTPTVLLVLEQEPYAKTCASLVLKTAAAIPAVPASTTAPPSASTPSHCQLFQGLRVEVEVVETRGMGKKPAGRVNANFLAAAQESAIGNLATSGRGM